MVPTLPSQPPVLPMLQVVAGAHNLQLFTTDSSKIEVLETCLYDMVTTQYDHPGYVKHVLGRMYVFFTLFVH